MRFESPSQEFNLSHRWGRLSMWVRKNVIDRDLFIHLHQKNERCCQDYETILWTENGSRRLQQVKSTFLFSLKCVHSKSKAAGREVPAKKKGKVSMYVDHMIASVVVQSEW